MSAGTGAVDDDGSGGDDAGRADERVVIGDGSDDDGVGGSCR